MITELERFSNRLNEVDDVIKNSIKALKNNNWEKEALDINNLYEERIKTRKPTIMLYGVFDAGKSTLINALMGEDLARVSDKPTTFKPDCYKWKNITLIDTPGIDAPIEHEEVSKELLMNTDVILFLVSDDSAADDKKIWEEIKMLYEANKPLIFIINDKKGYLNSSTPEEAKIIMRIKEKFRETAYKELGKNIDVMLVNAKRALQGKKEKKELLLTTSQINFVEDIIVNFLKNIDQLTIMLVPLQKTELYLTKLNQNIISELSNGDNYDKVIKYINDLKEKLKSEGEQVTKNRIIPLKDRIVSIILNSPNNAKYEIDNLINNEINETIEAFDKKVSIINNVAKDEYKELLLAEDIKLDTDIKASQVIIDCSSQDTDNNKLGISKLNFAIPYTKVEEAIFHGLKGYLEKPRFMRNATWIQKLGSQAKAISLGLQVIISVVTTATDIIRDLKDAEKQAESHKAFTRDINVQASQMVGNLVDEIINEINIAIHDSFKVLTNEIKSKKLEQDSKAKISLEKKEEIDNLLENIKSILEEFKIKELKHGITA